MNRDLAKVRILKLIEAKEKFSALADTIGLQVDSPINNVFYDILRVAYLATEHAYTGVAPVKDVGGEGWIEWFIWENDCGKRGHEAGYPDNRKPIRTVDDLLDMMQVA